MTRSRAPIAVLLVLALAAILHACGGTAAEGPVSGTAAARTAVGGPARVVRVVDGDTLKVRLQDGRRRTVRVLGIDTPEVKKPNTPIECGGPQASAAMRRLALEGSGVGARGRAVTLVGDPTQDAVDRYGRVLAYVDAGGRDLGQTLVAQGWAEPYVFRKPFQRYPDYRRAAERAENAGLGVWARCAGDFHSAQENR